MKFLSKKIVSILLRSALMLQLAGLGYAAEMTEFSASSTSLSQSHQITTQLRDQIKLTELRGIINGIEADKTHIQNLLMIRQSKWSCANQESIPLKLQIESMLNPQLSLSASLDAIETPHAGDQRIIGAAIYCCAGLAERDNEELDRFLVFFPTVFEAFRKLGSIQVASEDPTIRSFPLLSFFLDVTEAGALALKSTDFLVDWGVSEILKESQGADFFEELDGLIPFINQWLSEFSKRYEQAEEESDGAWTELKKFNDSIAVDDILSLSADGATATAACFLNLEQIYNKTNVKFQSLDVFRQIIDGLGRWISLQDKYFEEIRHI